MKKISNQIFSIENFQKVAFKWTPRAVVGGFIGYYSLGYAYDIGLMAAIDRVAIKVIKKYVGRLGLGATMPYFQWYAAWGVRILAAGFAIATYELIAKICSIIAPLLITASYQ